MNKALGLLASVTLTMVYISGCSQQATSPPPVTQTVSWYESHKDERTAKVKWCADDASRQATADCMNASKAAEKVMQQPNAPSISDNVKF